MVIDENAIGGLTYWDEAILTMVAMTTHFTKGEQIQVEGDWTNNNDQRCMGARGGSANNGTPMTG